MHTSESEATLPALFARVVSERAQHEAVVTARGTLSYAALDQSSARLARALLASGAGKGTRIALLAPDGIEWLTSFLAGLRIGAVVICVSTLCTPPELNHILRHSDTQILLGVRRFLRHDYVNTLTTAMPGLAQQPAEALQLPDAPYLRTVWLDDAAGISWAGSIEQLTRRADSPEAPGSRLLCAIEKEVAPSDEAVIVYTSGSTSLPKAVMHTQGNVARHPPQLAKYFLLKPDDRMMPLLPAFWLGGMAMALQTLSVGATLVYPESPDLGTVLETLQRFEVNRVNSWGDMLVKLREAAVARGIDVEQIVGLGHFRDAHGELIPPHLQVNMLGMSETFAPHSAERLDLRLPEDKSGSSGRTVNGYERRVVNPETGVEVPPGEVGELQLRGGALMSGFYKMERSRVFTPDGFYPTGDLVRLDADGHLYFIARRTDMIKTKAANVSRLEVEAALRKLPEVEVALVAGLPDPEFGQLVVAAVVTKDGTTATEESLRRALRNTLSTYKIPRRIVFISLAEVPRTSTGKIKLSEIASLIAPRLGKAAPGAAPADRCRDRE